jgi:hypothetical protein
MASKCLFTAIASEITVLGNSDDDKVKLAALKFLGHWIVDLHQPVHVSYEDDGIVAPLGLASVSLQSRFRAVAPGNRWRARPPTWAA